MPLLSPLAFRLINPPGLEEPLKSSAEFETWTIMILAILLGKGRVTGVGQSFGWTPGKRQSPSYVFCFSLNLVSLVLTIVVNRICLWIIPMLTLLHQKKLNTIIFVFKSSMTPMVVFHATLGKPRAHVFWVEGLYEAGFLKQQKFPLSVVKGW